MKISFLEPHLGMFGGIRRIVELSNRLTGMGHEVTIFHSDGSPCRWMECFARVKPFPELLAERHDALIYNNPTATEYELARKADAGTKVFYVLELYDTEILIGKDYSIYLPWHKRELFVAKSLRAADLVLSNATWEKEWLEQNLGIDSVLLIGGINTEMFHPVDVERVGDEIRILCSGDPRERKGTATVLEAVEMARRQEPRIALDTYHGQGIPQEKMGEKYSSADIFVESSWQAGWNNPVVEAMACKTPVICTDIGGVRDFAFHEKTALLVPPKDPPALAEAILRLIRDRELRDSLRERAFDHVTRFDWDESAGKLARILGDKCKARGGRSAPRGLDPIEMPIVKSIKFLEQTLGKIRSVRARS